MILLGSIDFFEQTSVPQVGFSAPLLDAKSGEIIQMEFCYASGDGYGTILGLGRVDDIEELTRRELHKMFLALNKEAERHIDTRIPGTEDSGSRPAIILIPFQNLTETGTINQIVSHIVLEALFHEGYRVIEPGMVEYQLRSRLVLPYGEIDEDNLRALADDFGAEYCITGSINQYAMTSSQAGLTVPSVEIFTRILDASTGKLLWAGHIQRSGDDYSTVLGLGTILSSGKLLQHSIIDLLRSIPDNILQNSKLQTITGLNE